jgi:uncharacterized protein (TIGR02145 family)
MITQYHKLAFTAALGLAFILTFSCGEHSWEEIFEPDSSSSQQQSSNGGTLTDSRDGKTYKTVNIGEQVWMAENLNYDIDGSKCYKNDPANCEKYGRLYDWHAAMAACPSGWHLPSDEEWNVLMKFIDPDCDGKSTCYGAGTKLKATSGWNDDGKNSGNGTDDFGFTALPGGDGSSGGSFTKIGDQSYWWGSSEDNADKAYFWYVLSRKDMSHNSGNKERNLSVRCLKGYSSSQYQIGVIYSDPVTDCGETYQTVVIGTQTWMARNLNYYIKGSVCYKDDPANCEKYGRLYDWATAMGIDAKYNGIELGENDVKHQGICPEGWYIPSDDDWTTLKKFVGSAAGKKLKANSDLWSSNTGTDNYGFAALPGGYKSLDDSFISVGSSGYWWSATECNYTDAKLRANNAYLRNISSDISSNVFGKDHLYSVRCLKGSSSSSNQSNSSRICNSSSSMQTGVIYGDPVTYQGEKYKTVVMGTQTWFQRNLNYAAPGSKCGNVTTGNGKLTDGNTATCDAYGRLYNWETAMALPNCNTAECKSQIEEKHQGICPSGWHIPSNDDWNVLMKFLDPSCSNNNICWEATKLKATSGWNDYEGKSGNGTDNFEFSALPGGYGYPNGNFRYVGDYGQWWSSTERDNTFAYSREMYYSTEYVQYVHSEKSLLYSVRCVKD